MKKSVRKKKYDIIVDTERGSIGRISATENQELLKNRKLFKNIE